MLNEERHLYITNQLKRNGIVKSQELMEELNCSESTIRRDLALLEEEGKLKRIHGGARRVYALGEEKSVREKTFKNVHEKKKIAEMAAALVHNGDTIYLDAGTTTQYMIPFLASKSVQIVTNAVRHADLLSEQNNDVYLLGGKVKNTTRAVVGTGALDQLSQFRFNKAFLGMNGIDVEFGCTTPDPDEAAVKRHAHLHSSSTFVLTDRSKFNKVHFVKVCDIDDVTILTEWLEKKDFSDYFSATKILEVKA